MENPGLGGPFSFRRKRTWLKRRCFCSIRQRLNVYANQSQRLVVDRWCRLMCVCVSKHTLLEGMEVGG